MNPACGQMSGSWRVENMSDPSSVWQTSCFMVLSSAAITSSSSSSVNTARSKQRTVVLFYGCCPCSYCESEVNALEMRIKQGYWECWSVEHFDVQPVTEGWRSRDRE
ncbi:hypothetical protein ElyMa_003168300 [Elysia marginata]|uniref:Uncharacterized protein n=1 Tax=Elysia marginata TaxID=1093978 RepID=A0AAV4J089_9GAST|nr:hypothetical protein ElyMa_003168300 [Elysia marginata]